MGSPFDPYHKWLGIPPKDQPPNHYRLLGLEIFEDDADVIEAAANRQMAYLQEVSVDADAMESAQRLLNEIAAARVCLLNPQRKAAYDAHLGQRRETRQVDHECPPPPPPPPLVIKPPTVEPETPADRQSSKYLTGGIASLFICGLLIAVAAIFSRPRSSGKPGAPPATAPTPPSTPDPPPAAECRVIVDWPLGERTSARMKVNGRTRRIPDTAQFSLLLKPGHNLLSFERPGYVMAELSHIFARGEDVHFSPAWEPLREQAPTPRQAEAHRAPGQITSAASQDPSPANQPPPAVKKPTKPATDRPDAAQAANVLAGLPPRFQLPAWDANQQAQPQPLCALPPSADVTLELVGGDAVLPPPAALLLNPAKADSAGRRWVVSYRGNGHPPVEVACFAQAGNNLTFHWRGTRAEGTQLRNCLLRIRAGKQAETRPLRVPDQVESLVLRGPTFSCREPLVLNAVPLGGRLTCALVELNPPKPWVVEFVAREAPVGEPLTAFLRLPENPVAGVELQCELEPLDISEGRFRLDFRALFSVGSGDKKVLNFRTIRAIADELRIHSARLAASEQKPLAEQAEAFRNFAQHLLQLADREQNAEIRLRYRVSYMIGDQRVDLAIARPEGDATPEPARRP